MKKFFLLINLIALTGCAINEIDTSSLTIIAPTGAPAIAFYNEGNNPNFETNSVPSNIVAMMNNSNGKDVVVIDTVSGIKAINNGAPYKMAATITFGNFFLAATGNDIDKTLTNDDNIVLFGQGQTPDLIFHYLYGHEFDNNIEYVNNVSDATKYLLTGTSLETKKDVDYVFIAEPVLSKALSNESAKTYGKSYVYQDIQKAYQEKSNLKMIQASLFINNNVESDIANAYLNTLKTDINKLLDNPSLVKDSFDVLGEKASTIYGVEGETAKNVLENDNALGLGFEYSRDIKEDIDNFISLFNLGETNEEIYF